MSEFSGYPLTRWDGNRIMILEEDFFYIDKKGKKWLVPKKGELNGATIPRSLWCLIGPPFVGSYRRASVVHDYFVGEGNNPNVTYPKRRAADKMFYRACRTDGCSWKLSAILYIGVSVGSWASKTHLKHSLVSEDLVPLSFEEDKLIERKYLNLRAKAEILIENEEDFDALEILIENEIKNN